MEAIAVKAKKIGFIHEITCKPNDGLFHLNLSHNKSVVQQEPLENNVDGYNKGSICSDTYKITEKTSQNTPIITTYQNATILNMF